MLGFKELARLIGARHLCVFPEEEMISDELDEFYFLEGGRFLRQTTYHEGSDSETTIEQESTSCRAAST